MITTDKIKIEDNRIFINDVVFPNYSVIKYLGGGKNGIVYLVKNDILLREEALKIWIKNNEDKRDKMQQGLLETQKLSKINGKHSIQIYNASVFENHILANMEYFEGQTLKDFIKDKRHRFQNGNGYDERISRRVRRAFEKVKSKEKSAYFL